MFSTAGSVGDMATRHHSGSVRRWRNRSTASTAGSGIVSPSTPLHNSGRSNTMRTSSTVNCTTTTTTFLPELTSTPPMPTFQKPSPLPSPRQGILSRENRENNLPHRHHSITLTPPSHSSPEPSHLPPIADPGRLLTTPATPKPNPVLVDGLEETRPIPNSWTQHHDRAICVLDAKGYSLHTIVSHLRKNFPRELRGSILTPAMVDKRLRVLDQDVEIDYWRVGLGLVRGGGGGGGERVVGSDDWEDVVSAATAAASAASAVDEGRSQPFGSWMEEERFRHSSASTPSAAGARGKGRARMQEPRLKTTISGNLLKSSSIANLLS